MKRYVRKICQKICRNECQKICQKECQKICQKECQKICQTECQKICQTKCQKMCVTDSFRGSSDKIGRIQRRLACPLRKDDKKSREPHPSLVVGLPHPCGQLDFAPLFSCFEGTWPRTSPLTLMKAQSQSEIALFTTWRFFPQQITALRYCLKLTPFLILFYLACGLRKKQDVQRLQHKCKGMDGSGVAFD